ncbi:HAMP domain-containing histidine kinase [Cohnella pontilimi]|uniref:histidine kinase n=1 Tax=Cohnella pontilimi TaxID=2564100 RepID=A0A4U0FBI6_9BACL|nr:HAMP domain-containing sensor histidine kinase [Cohnella pontilimi]TJY42213.1 HAMP domain-containing histidine kinase [Cohnella pontilimi]
MSIRIRLLLSYLAMLLVPLVLLSISIVIIAASVFGDLRSVFTLDTQHKNPIAAVLGEEADIAADIRLRMSNSPDSLRDKALMQEYSDRLKKINMGLIVRLDDQVIFASPAFDGTNVPAQLPAYGSGSNHFDKMAEASDHNWLLNRQYDVTFPDGSKGSYYILMNVDFLNFFMAKFSKSFLITLLVILVVVNGILTYFVSRSIIRPLRALKRAAGEIKEGNLNYQVRPESRDEIGELAWAFEEMRLKLKESIDLQLQYEDNRKNLISNISHDLKTPMTAIKGYVEGIMDGVTDTPEKLDRYVKTIHNRTVQLDHMIDELFLFSKLDLKGLPFHFEEVELSSFLQDCTEELQMDAEKRGVQLVYESPVSAQPAMIIGDRDKLKRVFTNIIENAMKYMDKEDGRIWISLNEEKDVYRVVIKDNGRGISPEALPHIFDRFYRADPSRNANAGGSGLGLAIAKHIVEEHGGTINAASELGVGTVMMISLKKRNDGGIQV